ncbi:MAG TPA: outer membrane protein transport protein [Polyangiaceae bacterium]
MRARAALSIAAIVLAPSSARAAAGAAFGETSRVAALGDAVTARPGDPGTTLLNPAGLADLKEASFLFGGHADYVSQWMQRAGDPASQDRSRGFGGFYLAAATPLPGPAWAHRIGVGFALDMPAQYLLHLDIPVRADQPIAPTYDSRPDRLAGAFALGVKVLPRVEIGAGFAFTPSLVEPALITYEAGRAPNVNGNVQVRIDTTLDTQVSSYLGLRAEPFDWLAVSLVWRDAQISRASGQQTTTAAGISAAGPFNFYQMWDPSTVVVGTAFYPSKRISLSLDVAWQGWSQFHDGFDQALPPAIAFHDTVSVSSGVEIALPKGVALRGGLSFEPSPIPEQTGETNYLGGNAIIAALGAGFDFRALAKLPFAIDAHVRVRAESVESATKDASTLPDADPQLAGTQIDNMGYPGFRSQAFLVEGGVTATIFIGGRR